MIYIYEPRSSCTYLGAQADSALQQLTEPWNQVAQNGHIKVLQTLKTKHAHTNTSHNRLHSNIFSPHLPSWSYHIDGLHHWGGLGSTQSSGIHGTLGKQGEGVRETKR